MTSNKEILEEIAKSIRTINHNSTTTAKAIDKISESIEAMRITISKLDSRNQAQHSNILNQLKQQWKLFLAAFVILGGLVGIKIYLP